MTVLEADAAVLDRRARWRYRGQSRPDFAEPVGPGEESVWDFPRPPRVEPVTVRLKVLEGAEVLAETVSGVRVLETAGAPTYYFPPGDVAALGSDVSPAARLRETGGDSLCEWKGMATGLGTERVPRAAWCYRETFPEYRMLLGWVAFYPGRLACFVGDEQVDPQPGGYYGGWVTSALKGPIKGLPGTEHW